ncbi:MAG: TorD/DmsD family molecular chaperone [Bacillota bacterium]
MTITPFLETRLALFQLLQAAFAAPVTPDLAEALAEASGLYADLVGLSAPPLPEPSLPEDLHEFHRLFVGPAALVAPPYESVYLSAAKALRQEETLAVRSCYQAHGLGLPPGSTEPDDHLAYELAFYAHLQARALEAQAGGGEVLPLLAAQAAFRTEHLQRWVPAFAARVIEGSRSPFYRSLALLLRDVVRSEDRILATLTERLVAKEENVYEGSL